MAGTVLMYHPELEVELEVMESMVEVKQRSGWELVDAPAPALEDEYEREEEFDDDDED